MNKLTIISVVSFLIGFTKAANSNCWSIDYGYSCCEKTCKAIMTDNTGKWGIENDQWCGIVDDNCNKQDSSCWSLPEYPCCKGNVIVQSDDNGDWGFEDNQWCGINKKSEKIPNQVPLSAQTYYLPTGDYSLDEKDRPAIEVHLPKPELANGCAVILLPGGAMRWLSWDSDVIKMASFLNERGIAAIGLRYHLNKSPSQNVNMPPTVDVTHFQQFSKADANPMHDAQGDAVIEMAAKDAKAAIRMVREHANEWNINKNKIGFLGFSAGGGVAIAATTSTSEAIERPNFLCTNYGPSLMPVSVTSNAPPLLIMTRVEHPNVAAGLVALFMEWKKAGANAELHMYGDGSGPYELMSETGETTTETWSSQMIHWFKAKGFIPRS